MGNARFIASQCVTRLPGTFLVLARSARIMSGTVWGEVAGIGNGGLCAGYQGGFSILDDGQNKLRWSAFCAAEGHDVTCGVVFATLYEVRALNPLQHGSKFGGSIFDAFT